ncbi:protein translocase subunit SecF [Vibrio olivae]|uniref:Protein translocase subunit SecF n=1 Tax=Vibrio olivae TaxID=1243002 RepID=A0ABV5HRX8_9VIBR
MINFCKRYIRQIRYITSAISLVLMVFSLVMLMTRGLNMGLDFTGGRVTEVQVEQQITRNELLNALKPHLGELATATHSDEQGRWVIRYAGDPRNDEVNFEQWLSSISHQVTVVSDSLVGAQVGQELVDEGGMALLVSVLCILGYLCFRFEWRLASGSLMALLHDVVLVLGFFAMSQMEFNLTVFAALLAILGYSLNDSIIVSDRIRELLVAKKDSSTADINDQAILGTFSRTMVTSGTTLITIAALWLMGGHALQGFSTAMFIGVLTGTWSSISIGTVLPEWFKLRSRHYQPVEIDAAP